MNTNFTLIDSQKARALVEMKIDHIHVSILAASGKTYAKVHPNKTEETFFAIKEMLKYIACLKSIKNQHLGGPDYPLGPLPHIGMHYVLFNENYQEIDEMVNLAMEVAADSVEFPLIDIVPGKTDPLLLSKEELDFVYKELKRQVKKIELYNPTVPVKLQIVNKELIESRLDSDQAEDGKYEVDSVIKQPCYVGWMFLRILANGEVNSCLKSHRLCLGNIYERSIQDIWNNDKQRLFRQKALRHDPQDVFFHMIGNDVATFGCADSCDNIKINIEMHNKYGGLLKHHGKIK
jgi:MoaA/NifB/PqqE/SkfB family radical SAM enzyme